jgi:hypothetical protein
MSPLGDPAPARVVRLECSGEWGLSASVPTLCCCFPVLMSVRAEDFSSGAQGLASPQDRHAAVLRPRRRNEESISTYEELWPTSSPASVAFWGKPIVFWVKE